MILNCGQKIGKIEKIRGIQNSYITNYYYICVV